LGAIDDGRVKFLNAIESAWLSRDKSDYRFSQWIPCDQLIMAVFLDDSCVTSSSSYWV
jgi:hypothetical protein